MAFCVQCGAKLEEGAKFCTNCGARQPQQPVQQPAQQPVQQPVQQPAASYDPSLYTAPNRGGSPKKSGGGNKTVKIVCIVLAALVVIGAVAWIAISKIGGPSAAGSEVADEVLGLYEARKAELGGMKISISDMWSKGFSIELRDKGKCEVNVDGTKGKAKWSLEDGVFTLSGSGLDCSGTLDNGVLVLEDVMGTGVKLSFVKEGAELPPEETPAAPVIPDEKPEAPTEAPDKEKPAETPAPAQSGSDPVLGRYAAVKAEMFGIEMSVETMWENGFELELQDGGVCQIRVDGNSSEGSWKLSGETITIQLGEMTMSGTLSEGELTLENVLNMGLKLSFVKADGSAPAPAAAPVEEEPEEISAFWDGDWYGWWVCYDCGGKYADMDYFDRPWDICGRIETDGSTGWIGLWDEDMEYDYIAEAEVRFVEGLSGKGRMESVEGYFYNDPLTDGEWTLDPAEGQSAMFDNLIVLHGRYVSPSDAESWMEYYIVMRPWGTRWEDMSLGDTSGMIYPGDMLPIHYDEWYLPLINAGEPMPEDFAGLK